MARAFLILCVVFHSGVWAADPPPLMTRAEARAFALNWFEPWGQGVEGVEPLVAFYTEDAFYRDPNVPQGISGKDRLRTFFFQMLPGLKTWKFEIVDVYPTERGFLLNWKASFRLGDRFIDDFRGVDLVEFTDGKISRHEDYFDLSLLLSGAR